MARPSPPRLVVLVAALAAGSAAAHSLSDEVTLLGTRATETNPRTGGVANFLSGMLELSDAWAVRADFGYTRDSGTRTPDGAVSTSGSNILAFAGGVGWLPDEHWSLDLGAEWSPRSEQRASTVVEFSSPLRGTQEADAVLASSTASFGISLAGGYATSSSSTLEGLFDGVVGLTHYDTRQQLEQLRQPNGVEVNLAEVQAACANARTALQRARCRPLLAALGQQQASLNEVRVSIGVNGTLFDDTDVGVIASYSFYDRDPTEVGYFSLLTVGRTIALGNGLAIAPLQWSVEPVVAHRFGALQLDLSYRYLRFAGDEGTGQAISVKAAYRFTPALRAWVRVTGEQDVPFEGTAFRSGTVSLGLRFGF